MHACERVSLGSMWRSRARESLQGSDPAHQTCSLIHTASNGNESWKKLPMTATGDVMLRSLNSTYRRLPATESARRMQVYTPADAKSVSESVNTQQMSRVTACLRLRQQDPVVLFHIVNPEIKETCAVGMHPRTARVRTKWIRVTDESAQSNLPR
jgi:hypothetical protein